VLNCPRGSIGPDLIAKAIALDCGSPATGRKLQMTAPGPDLKFARGLLTGDFHVAISDTIGIGRSTVRFATLRMPQKGTVKWFNPTKGYGFIKPNGSDKDVFVHISAVERAGLSTLNENQVVEYDLVENRGKASAENLKVS
jgi:CspA family cold shock protein